jgi:hypothetical protein
MALGTLAKGLLLGVAGLGGYAVMKGSSDEPREAQKDESTATATQGQGTDGNGGQYNFSELEMNAFKSTNVAYLDKKLADGTANFWDALAAKQFLGMNLGEYGVQNINMNMNAKMQLAKDAQYLQDLSNTNLLIDNSIGLSEDNLGVFPALERWANGATGKFVNLSDRGAQFQSSHENIIRNYAKAQKGGKPSNQDIKDNKLIYGLGASGELNYIERMYQMKYDITDKLQKQIDMLQAQGRPVPPEALYELENAKASLAFLENQRTAMEEGKKFDYKGWAQFGNRGKFDPQNAANKKAAQSVVKRN